MAGTTGLEPAASEVTESQDAVTDWNHGAWVAPYYPVRYASEGLFREILPAKQVIGLGRIYLRAALSLGNVT